MNNLTETKKLNTGKIGFILCLVVLGGLCLSSPWIITPLMIIILPVLLLILFLSVILCTHGLITKQGGKSARTGLLINIFMIVVLPFTFITFTPPGLLPHPLNIYKFKRALECDFWLDYDKEHMIDVQSQNTFILSKQGAIRFQSAPNTFQNDSVIKYAENHGWKYHLSVKLTKEDFEKYEEEKWDWDVINMLKPSPILLKKDCSVLVFETGNIHGMASYIMISNDLSEMVVFFYNPRLPDPAMKFWISEGFKELNRIQSE